MSSLEPDPHADWTPIVVGGPLPMDVATTLMQLIGTAYPSAVIDVSGKRGGSLGWGEKPALVMLIDPKTRAKRVTKKQIAEAKVHDDGDDLALVGFTEEDGKAVVQMTGTPEELQLYLGGIAHDLFSEIGGENYVEWEVHTEDRAQTYVLCIARSKRQTPHALRTRAEKELERMRADVRTVADSMAAGGSYSDVGMAADKLRSIAGE